jgi:hypothetical protein
MVSLHLFGVLHGVPHFLLYKPKNAAQAEEDSAHAIAMKTDLRKLLDCHGTDKADEIDEATEPS